MTIWRLNLPTAPDPSARKYAGDVHALATDLALWAQGVQQQLEILGRQLSTPIGQRLLTSNYTTNTIITGTTTGTDLANFVATLVAAMQAKGLISPTITRSDGA